MLFCSEMEMEMKFEFVNFVLQHFYFSHTLCDKLIVCISSENKKYMHAR